jgi:hypothetical protein
MRKSSYFASVRYSGAPRVLVVELADLLAEIEARRT